MKPNFLTVQIIHGGLLAGAIMYLLVMLFFLIDPSQLSFQVDSVFLYVILAIWAVIMLVHPIIYRKLKEQSREEDVYITKLEQYKQAKIVVWAMFEALSLVSMVFMLIEANAFFLVSAVLGLAFLTLKRPSKLEFHQDFKVKGNLD